MCLTLWYNLTVKHFQHMQLVTLSGTIFCGASWSDIEIEVIGTSKEECLAAFLKECCAIHLGRMNTKIHYSDVQIDRDNWKYAHHFDSDWMGKNIDFEIFKVNPEKYIDLYWEVTTLPFVNVKS